MRQSGIIAAGALYALQHHVDRLADDHLAAQRFADAVRESPGLTLVPDQVDTNIVFFAIDPQYGSANHFCQLLFERGVWTMPFGKNIVRACTHLDVSLEQVDQAATIVRQFAEQFVVA
mgnify:CR=1 FL=1